MISYVVFFLASAGLAYLSTPLVRRLALRANILDNPSERKIHQRAMPLLGGIPIFLSFNLTIVLAFIFAGSFFDARWVDNWPALLICQVVIIGLGIFDDLLKLGSLVKFVFQILVGVMIVLFGFGISSVANPLGGKIIALGVFSIPITIIWFVLITNALNLVDGLDGLATGTALIACLTLFALSHFHQNFGVAMLSLILAGSLLGFLRYNFYPAKIFLGDTGSLLLGFLLAFLSIQGSSKGATLVAIMAPILALGLPIMETLLSVIRRFLRSIHIIDYSTKNGSHRALFFRGLSFFKPDKNHVHHRLMNLGLSHKRAVLVLYIVCISLSLLAFLSVAVSNINLVAFMGAILLAFFIGVKSLKYEEFKILENGLLIPIFNFPVITKQFFLAFFDLSVISLSFYMSYILIFWRQVGQPIGFLIETISAFLLIKIAIFYLSGIYRISWLYSSLEEILKIIGAVFLSSLSALLISMLVIGIEPFGGFAFFVIDFYLVLTLVASLRISYRIINLYYKKGLINKGKKALIYGAGYRGSSALKEIRQNGTYMVLPIGFIDDDPSKKGKTIHGCPILGSIDDIERISGENEIAEIVVSSPKIGRDKINRMIDFCRMRGIVLRQFEFRFYEFS